MSRRTKIEKPIEPTTILDHNVCFEGDLRITFPLQDGQSPISVKTPEIPRSMQYYLNLNDYFNVSKHDRTGKMYKELVQLIYNDPKAHENLKYIFKSKSKFNFVKPVNEPTGPVLIRVNKDGSIDIKSLKLLYEYTDSTMDISKIKISKRNSSFKAKTITVKKGDIKDKVVDDFIGDLMPGSDLSNYEKIKPEIGKFSSFDGPRGSNVVPSYKEICFSTLKELFLINKESTIEKIRLLPLDLQSQFILNCSEDERPIGHEIVWTLYNIELKGKTDDGDSKRIESLFPLQTLISSSLKKDLWYRENYQFGFEHEPFKSNTTINVYDNFELFKYQPLSELEEKHYVLIKSKPLGGTKLPEIGSPSIVSKEEFLKNFHIGTRGLFKEKGIPKNFLFFGGLITSCLTGQTEGFEFSDIDVLMLNDGIADFQSDYTEAVAELFGGDFSEFEKSGYSIHAMGGHLTFSKQYPNRPIQFNIYSFKDIQEVLLGVDIDCSCFAMDHNEDVWTLERGLFSLNHRINFASEFSYLVRGENQYQRRLLKYQDRGYSVYYQNSPSIEKIIEKFDVSKACEFMSGFELLLAASKSNELMDKLKQSTKQRIFPYGPGWKKENFDRYMNECFENVYDGYSSSGVYCPVSSFDDMFQYLDDDKEPFQNYICWDIPALPEQFGIIENKRLDNEERFLELPELSTFINLNPNDDITAVGSKSLRTE